MWHRQTFDWVNIKLEATRGKRAAALTATLEAIWSKCFGWNVVKSKWNSSAAVLGVGVKGGYYFAQILAESLLACQSLLYCGIIISNENENALKMWLK